MPDLLADLAVRVVQSGWLPSRQLGREVSALGYRKSFNVARLNSLNKIVSPSQLMTAGLTANGVDKELITQCAFGIDIAGYHEHVQRPRSSGPVTFCFIGTLSPHKGCHVLIDAFRNIDPDKAKLRIFGDPNQSQDYFNDLKRLAAGLNSVEFCGTFPNYRIGEVLADIDCLVVPSPWCENTPLVVYSALAAKCPIVASDFPGLSEVVKDGHNGLLFPPPLRYC